MSLVPLSQVNKSDVLEGDPTPFEIYKISNFHQLEPGSFYYDDDTQTWVCLDSRKTVNQLWFESIK